MAGIAEMLVMTMPAQGAHELGEVAHAHLSGCADSGVEEQAGTVRICSSMHKCAAHCCACRGHDHGSSLRLAGCTGTAATVRWLQHAALAWGLGTQL